MKIHEPEYIFAGNVTRSEKEMTTFRSSKGMQRINDFIEVLKELIYKNIFPNSFVVTHVCAHSARKFFKAKSKENNQLLTVIKKSNLVEIVIKYGLPNERVDAIVFEVIFIISQKVLASLTLKINEATGNIFAADLKEEE